MKKTIKKRKISLKQGKHTSPVKTFPLEKKPYLVFSTVSLVVLCFALLFFIAYQVRYTPEGPTTDIRKIPKSVRASFPTGSYATLRVPILLYHYVEYVKDKHDKLRQTLNINPNIFDAQVKTLSDAGYTFMTNAELSDVLNGKAQLPAKPILLTFDDGHWDLYTDILPILEKYHAKATAYIISGFIGGSDFLTSEQLQKVIQSGFVEIGAHTVHHIALAGKLLPVVQYEVTHSKQDLESTYHLHIVSFAYPDGSFDKQAIQVVKDAGFSTAVSTVPGIQQSQINQYFLYRIRPGYRIGQELLTYLDQNTYKPW